MDRDTRKYIKDRIRVAKVFGLDYLSANDKLNVNVICSDKDYFNTGAFVSENSYSLDSVKESCVSAMELFDSGIADRAFNVMSFANIYQVHNEDFLFDSAIKYSKVNKNMIDIDSGYVDFIGAPFNLDDLSFLFLGHGLVHAIKDTNFKEFQYQLTLGDVIPGFYEMIIAEKMPHIYKKYWTRRFELVKMVITEYEGIYSDYNKSVFDKKIYEFLLSFKGQYLNGFYYSLVLYNLYQLYPDWVMKNVLRVLNHEITTKDLLVILGLYEMNNDDLVSDEIKKLSLYLNR